MATKKNDKPTDVTIVRDGSEIILPPAMSYDEGITWLQRKRDAEDAAANVCHVIEGAYLLDAAHAFSVALRERYGFVMPQGGTTVAVETAPGVTVPVPWGRFSVPTFKANASGGSWLGTDMAFTDDGSPCLQITARVRGADVERVAELAEDTRAVLRERSIYRGKALRVTFPAEPSPTHGPRFLPLTDMGPEDLVFSARVQRQITASIFTPITRTADCRAAGVPLKRGVLLEGPYGTGKTMTAHVAASLAVAHGWTFLYLDAVADLARAVAVARQYQPCVLFAEDIDREVSGARSASMDAILNTIDGIDGKGSEIMVILTTNHVDRIAQAMLRPGRLDDVITVSPPDGDAAVRLVRMYGRGLIDPAEDMARIGHVLAGQIPAVIRETVERAKLSAIARSEPGARLALTCDALLDAADGMLSHLRLLVPKPEDNRTDIERFGAVIGSYLEAGVAAAVHGHAAMIAVDEDHPEYGYGYNRSWKGIGTRADVPTVPGPGEGRG